MQQRYSEGNHYRGSPTSPSRHRTGLCAQRGRCRLGRLCLASHVPFAHSSPPRRDGKFIAPSLTLVRKGSVVSFFFLSPHPSFTYALVTCRRYCIGIRIGTTVR